jgi:DNA-binding IclR family transcriptional regulator
MQKIILLLAKKRNGLSLKEISNLTKISLSTITRCLDELTASTFIKEYVPFQNKKRNSYYRLIDEYK